MKTMTASSRKMAPAPQAEAMESAAPAETTDLDLNRALQRRLLGWLCPWPVGQSAPEDPLAEPAGTAEPGAGREAAEPAAAAGADVRAALSRNGAEENRGAGLTEADIDEMTALLAAPVVRTVRDTDSQPPTRPIGLEAEARLLALACLAGALDEAKIDRLFAPGRLTPLVVADRAMAVDLAAALDKPALTRLSHMGSGEGPTGRPRVVLFHREEGNDPRDELRQLAKHRADVRSHLAAGHPVIALIASPGDLDRRGAMLADPAIQLPPLDLETLLMMLRQSRGETGSQRLEELQGLLQGRKLAALSFVALRMALAQPSVDAVLDRLVELTTAEVGTPCDVTLEHLRGQETAVARLRQIAQDVAGWRRGEIDWAEVTASAVLHGPPGTGKTMAASALAGSLGVPLIATSFADAQKHGHMGDMLAALDRAVREAIDSAPSVFFLDELDSFPRRTAETSRNALYMTAVVNGLLEQLSRLRRHPGVIVLGATNHLDLVDPAVIRSGRFDLRIEMALPAREGLIDLLTAGLAQLKTDARISRSAIAALANRLIGRSPADIMALLREAASIARSEGRNLQMKDLRALAKRISPEPDAETLWTMAVHEAGHLIVGQQLLRRMPRHAEITGDGGRVDWALPAVAREEDLHARLATMLAGRAAEMLLLGAPSTGSAIGPESDLAKATALATAMETQFGYGETLVWEPTPRLALDCALRARVSARLQSAEAHAIEVLVLKRGALLAAANHLLTHRTLGPHALTRILKAEQHETAGVVVPFPGRGRNSKS